jgi:hypothetical protein
MKMMHGACALPCSNRSRTRLAPTPTNISTKSEPDIEKNGRPASPATALASSVFPVPGGPTRRAPLGRRPPSFVNFCGSLRNSMISCSSTLASSAPATSANVTFGVSPERSFAFDLPNENALFPPACIWRKRKNQNPMASRIGSQPMRKPPSDVRGSSAETFTPLSLSSLSWLSVIVVPGSVVVKFCAARGPLPAFTGVLNRPVTSVPPRTTTSFTLPRSTSWVKRV